MAGFEQAKGGISNERARLHPHCLIRNCAADNSVFINEFKYVIGVTLT